MSSPKTQEIALELAALWGIQSLDQNEGEAPIRPGGLRSLAYYMTATWARIFKDGPVQIRERPASFVLHAPTAVTLTATNASATISGLVTWADWMAGCTVRIAGDDQDNEILSATTLARPYMGTTGSVGATVYGDCITLGADTARVLGPMTCGGTCFVREVTDRRDYLTHGGYGWGSTVYGEGPIYAMPFYALGQKPSAQFPTVFFLDTIFDPALDYVPRRIRLSPMPSAALVISYTASMAPPRVTVADIQGVGQSDPQVKLPMVDGAVESIFLPIARQLCTGSPLFKNADAKAEIFRQYELALKDLKSSRGSVATGDAHFV